jgi:hypothetical protein
MTTRLSFAGVSTKWGVPATLLAAAFAVAQPSIPAPPPGGPSIDFPVQPQPSFSPTRPPTPLPGGAPAPLLPQSVNIALKVERDGRLSVTEQVFVQAGKTMTRRAPLRIQAGDDRDRVFTVHDAALEGNGSTEITADELVLRLGGGASTVRYTVDGAVINTGDHQEARWQVASGWDVKLNLLRASFIAPDPPGSVVCLAGEPGSRTPCDSAATDHGEVLRIVQQNLKAGNRIDLSVALAPRTVPANARFDSASSKAAAFAVTPVSGIGFGAVVLLVLGGFLLLWLARGRDAKALATDVGPVDVLLRDGERVSFASPDGVLPGQIGTVIDERVDPADLAATVVDLAVRNYLAITELPAGDWLLVRRNAPDAALTAYERAVIDTLLPARDQIRLSELSTVDISAIRDALYTDVVARDWFTHRPDRERTRWAVAGAVLILAGVATTAVLALTIGHALIGLAMIIGGVALALGARWMPARTRRGSTLVQQVRGLLTYLHAADPTAIPAPDRPVVLSRSLPYAIALGQADRWLPLLETPYWYEGTPANLPAFLTTLTARLK